MTPTSAAGRLAAVLLLLLGATAARAASLSLEGNAVVLGRTESIGVVIRVDEPPGTEELPLRLSVNVGSFSEPVRLAPGKYRAVYVPPETRFPQVALVAIWRETGYDAHIDFMRIPLFGVTKIEVSAKPRSEVKATMGFDVFGPVRADKHGKAVIPLVVPPNVYQATVSVKEPNGATANRQVPVEVPPYNRLTAALVPHAVVADGQNPARLDVLYDLGGVDVSPEQVRVKASIGSVTFQRAARGLYVYRYLPPVGTSAKEVLLSVSISTDPTARATAKLTLGLPPPARILVHPPAKSLVAGSGQSAPASALVLDDAGLGLAGQTVRITANGQPLGTTVYRGSGVYEAPYSAPSAYPPGGLVQFQATASDNRRTVNGSANYQLQAAALPKAVSAQFAPSPVPADGRTEAQMVLDVRDDAGLPLERAQLIVAASHGTLGKLTERGQGLYQASYTAPASVPDGGAFIRVVDPSGAFERSVPLPLRENPHRLLLGLRGGYVKGLGDLSGPRLGLDLTLPFRVGRGWFSASLAAQYGTASRSITDPGSGLASRSEATFVPVSLRLAWELWSNRRLSLSIGGGGVATLARFKNSLASDQSSGTGFGGLGFLAGGLAIGPGQVFAEASYAYAPVNVPGFRLDAGGVGIELGYRVGVF